MTEKRYLVRSRPLKERAAATPATDWRQVADMLALRQAKDFVRDSCTDIKILKDGHAVE